MNGISNQLKEKLFHKNGFNILLIGTCKDPCIIEVPPFAETLEEAKRWVFFYGGHRRDIVTP